jgi:ADP-ribosyl-[dinitrogen reductase] hydrolase
MYGVILGDIIGSRFEFMATGEKDVLFFHPACTFTDDTVCACAVAASTLVILDNLKVHQQMQKNYPEQYVQEQPHSANEWDFLLKIYAKSLRQLVHEYPMAGYGKQFMNWAHNVETLPYESLGNGCLMRVAPIALLAHSLEQAKWFAKACTSVTHNHPEALKSVDNYLDIFWFIREYQTTMTSDNANDDLWLQVFKDALKNKISILGLDVQSVEQYRSIGGFHVLAPDTLVRSLACVLEATNYEEAIGNALYIASDTDTTAAIAGALAEMIFGLSIDSLDKSIEYFNHKSIQLMKNMAQAYRYTYQNEKVQHLEDIKDNTLSHYSWGNLAWNNLFSDKKREWNDKLIALEMVDMTAQWDPLALPEDDDEYYSEADMALKKSNQNAFIQMLRKMGVIR